MHHRDGELPVFPVVARCGVFVDAVDDSYVHRQDSGFVMKKLFRDSRGGAMVEFALVALPVLVFLCGIMQTGWVVWVDNLLQVSVDAAARCGAVNSTTSPCAGGTTANMISTANQVFGPMSGASFSANTS